METEKITTLETQIYELQKQLRLKEAYYSKDKAIWEQKLEILEIQNKESKIRYF